MTNTTPPTRTHHAGAPRNRRRALMWTSGAAAAAILVLGTSGTLSSWTAAIITDNTNSAQTASAVILTETDGSATCASSDAPTTNTYTCTTINTYGGTTVKLTPGASRNVDITFSNTGSKNGTSFEVVPGACTQSPVAATLVTDLCTTAANLTVAVSCTAGATYTGTPWTDLVYAAGLAPTGTLTHTAAAGDLNASASWTCRFTVALNAAASVLGQNVTVTQPMVWTLT